MRGIGFAPGEIAVKAVLFSIFLLAAGNASASCELVSRPYSTDSSGNTYTTQQNLGGGYNTYRNGILHSQTSQQLDGRYRETYSGGGYRIYDRNPYRSNSQGRRDP
jgi:hypothetical protein